MTATFIRFADFPYRDLSSGEGGGGVNATPLQITVPGEDLYLSEVAELAWSTCLGGWKSGGDGLPEIPRIPPSIANESLSLFLRPARFDFTARYGMSCLEYARTTTTSPSPREPRVSDCAANQIYFTCSSIFSVNFFSLLSFLTGFVVICKITRDWQEDCCKQIFLYPI